MKYEYSVFVVWSQEDQSYLAMIHELPGCMADGSTPEEAIGNVRVVVQEWISVAKEEGRKIPEPMSHEDCMAIQDRHNEAMQKHFNETVERALREIIPKILTDLQEEDQPKLGFRSRVSPWELGKPIN